MKKKKLWLVTGVAAAAVLAAGTVTFASVSYTHLTLPTKA